MFFNLLFFHIGFLHCSKSDFVTNWLLQKLAEICEQRPFFIKLTHVSNRVFLFYLIFMFSFFKNRCFSQLLFLMSQMDLPIQLASLCSHAQVCVYACALSTRPSFSHLTKTLNVTIYENIRWNTYTFMVGSGFLKRISNYNEDPAHEHNMCPYFVFYKQMHVDADNVHKDTIVYAIRASGYTCCCAWLCFWKNIVFNTKSFYSD